jgi:hypothetical protein
MLCALGLAGPVFALIEQPRLGWSSPGVIGPLVAGVVLLGLFVAFERRCRDPMLPLELFRHHNFAVGNVETLAMYGGLSLVFFVLVVYLQQVAGYSALKAGLSTLPSTIVMFALSRRFGALADRLGPRLFMGAGPIVAAVGILMLAMQIGVNVGYFTDLLPGLLVFAVGLSMTVAPLTATVLAGVDEQHAGIASAVNNAIARVASLVCVAALGAVVAAQFNAGLDARLRGPETARVRQARALTLARVPGVPAVEAASVEAFHFGVGVSAAMVALGGVLGLAGIRNPRRKVSCADCAEGAPALHSPPYAHGRSLTHRS